MRSLISDSWGGAVDSPLAVLASFTCETSFSDCSRSPASSTRSAPTDFSSASILAAAAGSGTKAGLLVFDSRLAIRVVRSSIAAALTAGAAGLFDGAISPGQPNSHANASTSAAAQAPETAAIAAEEVGVRQRPWTLRLDSARASLLGASLGASFGASADTSVASRSMVGGARLARPASGDGSISSGLSSTIPRVPSRVCGRFRPIALSTALAGAKHDPTHRTRHFHRARPPP